MADVLSQSQIDALLKSMQGSGPEEEVQAVEQKTEAEETKYSKYDFYSPRTVSYTHLDVYKRQV